MNKLRNAIQAKNNFPPRPDDNDNVMLKDLHSEGLGTILSFNNKKWQ